MSYNKVFCILALALIFSLLMLALPATPALAFAGAITMSPATGPVGTTVTVNGTGFTPNSSFTVTFDTTTVDSGPCDGWGNFLASFPVPTKARGQYPVTATTPAGDTCNTINFTVTSKVTPSPLTAYVGDTVTVSGTGFKASASVTIYFDTSSVGTTTADANGSFSGVTFTVPACSGGTHTVKGADTEGNSPTVNLTIPQKVTVTPTSGAVGDTVTVNGTAFAAISSVTIYFDATNVGTATTDANGTFPNTTLTIPSTSRGNHTIKAQDASSNYATVTFAVASKITTTPSDGAPGMTVTVDGTGFGASKTITIKYNAVTVTTTPATINTDASGNFTASFTVPTGAAGTYLVEASDGTYSASANFTITINITLSEITSEASPGYVGMDMTISGAGFKPNSEITIRYATTPIVVATVASNSEGAFSVTFKIPASEHGTHTITASDGTSTLETTFFMESTAPATPKLLLPTTSEKAKSRTVFDWENVTKDVNGADEPSTPVTYDLQIAFDATFTNIVLERTGLTTSGYTLIKGEALESTKEGAPYYWRVRAVDAASNASDWTSSRTFYVSGFDWVLYGLIGAGILVIFFIGFAAGRKSKRSYY